MYIISTFGNWHSLQNLWHLWLLKSSGMFHHCTLCNIIHFQCTKWEETGTLIRVFVVSKLCPLVESIQTSKLSYNTNKHHLHKLQISYVIQQKYMNRRPMGLITYISTMRNWSSNVLCIYIYFLLHNLVSIFIKRNYG